MNPGVLTGLERLVSDPSMARDWGRLGLLYNQASVNRGYESAASLLHYVLPDRLSVLFGPQHGAWVTEQDNMVETGHHVHPHLNIPIFSLYSQTRRPEPQALDMVDTIIVDIQDVGTRVYTFATTLLYIMEDAARLGKQVVVLDRPNPVNGLRMEGNLLEAEFESFVGPHPIPMRHGMTIAELALMFNGQRGLNCELLTVPMEGWQREMYFQDTGLPWVMPSPNMPLVETAMVYPGQVILEGTNISEGRGTTRPFEMFGAPFINPRRLSSHMDQDALKGITLRETAFKPTFNKWADEVCWGFQIHIRDRDRFRPFLFTIAFLRALMDLHPDHFQWSRGPYEYVFDKLPIDVILGGQNVRAAIEDPDPSSMGIEAFEDYPGSFLEERKSFLIYD